MEQPGSSDIPLKASRNDHPLNHLADEKSPYLLQHAGNPVDWFPWGEEAFARARLEGKPVFLSIGYSTCHWCHVMARESFEDIEIASILNRDYISVKVDREERPDIDSVYMGMCQQMTGQGGWPLTIIMTPEKKPFFAGTYFPKNNRGGMPGLFTILIRISELWQEKRHDLYATADQISQIPRPVFRSADTDPDQQLLDAGFSELCRQYDEQNGGFGKAPKFPAPHTLVFLFRYWYVTGETRAREMAEHTIDAICRGGIWDQLGGGLHRYATDGQWLVPHFEKMLYDQALFTIACIEAFEATGKNQYRSTAEQCISYVLNNLQDPGGAFYTAEDADSPEGEGAFYTWTDEEISGVLGPEDSKAAFTAYARTPLPGESSLSRSVLSIAGSLNTKCNPGVPGKDASERNEEIRQRLLAARKERPAPAQDQKILTDLNALFCVALARAGRVFGETGYIHRAREVVDFINKNLFDLDGNLLHRHYAGKSGINAFADDYVYLVAACLELYRSTFDITFLKKAIDLNRIFLLQFSDPEKGGFFTTPLTASDLLERRKEWYDGAVPSSNSVAYENLLRISRLTGDSQIENAARLCGRFLAGSASVAPSAATGFLSVVAEFSPQVQYDLVIGGDPGNDDTRAFLDSVRSRYLPGLSILVRPDGDRGDAVDAIAPVAKNHVSDKGSAIAYLCSPGMCLPPIRDPLLLSKHLSGGKNLRTS